MEGQNRGTQQPSVGRQVHYVLADNESAAGTGDHRPAVIVAVEDAERDVVELCATFSLRDMPGITNLQQSRVSVRHDERGAKGTWHWPEYVPPRD